MVPVGELPSVLSAANDVRIVGLIPRARDGRLVLYVGAGVSMDAGLPSGAGLANAVSDRLLANGIVLPGVDRDDLVGISDAAVGLADLRSVQEIAVDVAPFTSAAPTTAHRFIALLLLEGVAAVMSTNWDTCIERAAPVGERIASVATDDDRLSLRQRGLLKVHGCASRPRTILVTTAQLNAPPIWASDEIGAQLSSSTCIFVGIGDVAGYVSSRLKRLLVDLGRTSNVEVVAPTIESYWSSSEWSKLLPDSSSDDRFEMTAVQFCDALLRAWVNDALQVVVQSARDLEVAMLSSAVDVTVQIVRTHTADRVVRWLRAATQGIEAGNSAMRGGGTVEAFLALAYLTRGAPIEGIPDSGPPNSGIGRIDLHLSHRETAGTKAARAARARAQDYRARGLLTADELITIVCAGHVGPLEPKRASELASDIVAEDDAGDLIGGIRAGHVELVAASQVLEAVSA